MSQEADTSTTLSAGEILSSASLVNRSLYRAKIADFAEAQSEQSSPTIYTNFDAELGLGRLQDSGGNISYGNAQTNGAIAIGDAIRLRQGGVLAKYDSMPRTKQNLQTRTPKNAESPGLLMWLDCNWLDFDTPNRLNRKAVEEILKYFLSSRTLLFTMIPDNRQYFELGRTFGLIPWNGAPSLFSLMLDVISEKNINLISVELGDNSAKVNSAFLLPLLKQDVIFTPKEIRFLKLIAKKYGLIICGEWGSWRDYDNRILSALGLERIEFKSDYSGNDDWIPTKKNKLARRIFEEGKTLDTNASGSFKGTLKNEVVMTVPDGSPSVILVSAKQIK